MDKTLKLLNSISLITKAEDDELKEMIGQFPEVDWLIDYATEYESRINKLLKSQGKYYVNALKGFVSKDEDDSFTIAAFLTYALGDLFNEDEFVEKMTEEAKAFLYLTIPELTSKIMQSIDKDVPFKVTSQATVNWINAWIERLANLMNITTQESVKEALLDVVENGKGIPAAVLALEALPEFDRKRARATAITEVLTASSVAQHESYVQSPAVDGKTWLHSGSKKNKPRQAHVALNDTTIPVESKFDVNGYQADFPRDVTLPAKERVNCHCVLSPSVNQDILGLSKEEKAMIRQEVISDPEFEEEVARLKAEARQKYSKHD